MGRWWIVNLAFWVAGLGVLYVFTDRLRMPLMAGTLLAAEIMTVVRFLVNDSWVFGRDRPTWRRLWQFHVACAGGSAIWWSVANVLPRWGVHYLIASALGSACSAVFSLTTNFKWIWRGDARQSSTDQTAVGGRDARGAHAE
jgi:putative flippase GtrA